MRQIIAVVLLGVCISPVTLYCQADQAGFQQLETAWNNAHLHGDAAALDRLWHPDLVVVVPKMPPMSRADALAFARSGRMQFQRYETSDLNVRTYGNTALVSGRLRRSRTINGQQKDDDWRFTKVYLQDNSGWRVVSFHASDADTP